MVDTHFKTDTVLKRTVQVSYPAGSGRLILRTELDWEKDIESIHISEDGNTATFEVEANQPFLYFKAGLVQGDEFHWSAGENNLLLMSEPDQRGFFPHFLSPDQVSLENVIELPSRVLNRTHRIRVCLPPGYEENPLSTFPVAFMQDGQNLFFPEEAFMGNEWKIDETSQTLRAMGAVEDLVFVGIHSDDRMKDYTRPGYEAYARSLVEEIVPHIEQSFRVNKDRRDRVVWGSSLGGVVSFYTVWQYPKVFGAGVCMSSTFGHQDNLIERVLAEPAPNVGFYLDSGWPGDNYEVTLGMAMALVSRGWKYGHNLLHLSFPQAVHNETAWGTRLHLPFQFLNGAVARASRVHARELQD